MATRNVTKQANALAKARERRRALDKARDEQDERIEEATASVLFALEVRAEAERAFESATSQVGAVLKELLVEGVRAERAAALLELDVSQVRRLIRAAPPGASRSDLLNSQPKPAALVDSDRVERELSARRAG